MIASMNRSESVVLSEHWLRDRFAHEPAAAPLTSGDGWLWRPAAEIRTAAVMVPVVVREDELRVLFTVRTDHLYDHAGQISFPGGRTDPGDATVFDTALRESTEEIGLPRERVEVLGTLNEYITVTGYRVTPVIGLISAPPPLKLDAFEVADVFEVPLAFLLDPKNHQCNTVVHRGRERQYYAVPFGARYIWGATAGMLMNFCRYLGTPASGSA
jgi:8-oxo-dGTP pyrophosphatase MutT (NUDIX family)